MTNTETLKASGAQTQNGPGILRKIVPFIAGLLTTVILSLGTDGILFALGIFHESMSDQLFLIAAAHRIVYGVAGTYVTAWLAPERPMKYAMVSGVIGLILATVGVVGRLIMGPSLGPIWYPVALVVTAVPCAWVGGRLRQIQLSKEN